MTERRKKASAGGENGASNITLDIPHEELKNPADAVAVTPKVVPVEDQIKTEIAKFSLPDSAISQLKETYGGLTIKDETDKAGYETVKKAWNDVRSKRTGLEKKGLELRGQFKVITKAISDEEERLVGLISTLEDDLYTKWKKIDDDKERAKKEKEEAEGRQLMARIEELQTMGMSFKDGFYQIGETITADVATLRAMPEDMFGKLKTAIKNKADELKKIKEQEAEKKRQEQAEFKKQQDDLKAQQEQLAEQQRKIQEQHDQLKKDQEAAAKFKRDFRVSKFVGLGMVDNGDHVARNNGLETLRLDVADIMAWSDESYLLNFADWKKEIDASDKRLQEKQEKEKAEQAEKDRREKYIASCLENVGFKYNWGGKVFIFQTDALKIEVQWKEFDDLKTDQEIAEHVESYVHPIKVARDDQAKAEQKKKDDQAKAEKLALTDKQRWTREMEQMGAQALRVLPGDYKTDKYKKKAQTFLDRLNNLITEFKD